MTPIDSFRSLLDHARSGPAATVAVVAADNETALGAVSRAVAAGIARPVLVGDAAAGRTRVDELGLAPLQDAPWVWAAGPEEAARAAVALARSGEADVLLKGGLRTDQLLRAVLDRDTGLRTGRLLSDVLLYRDGLGDGGRLVAVSDGGINADPDAQALRQIVRNAVDVLRALGHERPRVALLSATEAVTPSVPSTVVAREVVEWAVEHLPEADVAGPLALDNALLPSAAEAKGIGGPVAGRADVLVAPGLEAGNILGKAAKYLAGSITAHVVTGARVPILIPSRVESVEDKLHSIALGVVVGRGAAR